MYISTEVVTVPHIHSLLPYIINIVKIKPAGSRHIAVVALSCSVTVNIENNSKH